MYRVCLLVYAAATLFIACWCESDFLQERAKLNYFNPKYIKDVVLVTNRKTRRDPYFTNLTGTILMPYGNNVSMRVSLVMTTGGDFRIPSKLCDSFKNKWMSEYTKTFTNLSINRCPLPAGRYMYKNVELPPKNIPVPLADGDYWLFFELYLTATKEPILKVETLLKYDKTRRYHKKTKG